MIRQNVIFVLLTILLSAIPWKSASVSSDLRILENYYQNGKYSEIINRLFSNELKNLDHPGKYLIYQTLKNNNSSEAYKALEELGEENEWYLKWIYYDGKIKQAQSENNFKELVTLVLSTKNLSTIPYFQKKIRDAFIKIGSTLDFNSSLKNQIDSIIPQNKKLQGDPDFLLLYLKHYRKINQGRKKILRLLWMNSDVHRIPEKIKREARRYLSDWFNNPEFAEHHFKVQFKSGNLKYLEEELPKYLKEIKFKTPKSFVLHRTMFFRVLIKNKKHRKALNLIRAKQSRFILDINPLEAIKLKFRVLLQMKNINQIRKTFGQLEKALTRKEVIKYNLQISDYFKRRGRYKTSLYYHQKIDPTLLSKEEVPHFQWNRFMLYIRVNKKKLALRLASRMSKEDLEDPMISSHFCYWNQKLKETLSKAKDTCYKNFPATFYGLRSKAKNLVLVKKDLLKGAFPHRNKPVLNGSFFSMLRVLYLTKENSLADQLIMEQLKRVDQQSKKEIIQFTGLMGRYKLMVTLGYQYFSPNGDIGVSEPERENWEFIYPLAYKGVIQKMKGKRKVPDFLIQAVIREESRFFPEAESVSGALGLMQLMPGTAKYIGRKIRDEVNVNKLFEPGKNIKLGVAYLEYLLRRYNGNLVYALAAYNGGATNVKRWRRKNRGNDLDMFIETIPFDETRRYVKKVLRSYFLYHAIYG